MTVVPIHIRQATMGDYYALVALFDELDEFHRRARPDVFRRFDGPSRTREQIDQWLAGPGSISVVAELRWLARGAAIASTSGSPLSR